MSPSPGRMYDVSRPLRDRGLNNPCDPEIRFRQHGLDLSAVPRGVYQFICLPLRLEGLDGAPARAVLIG